MSRSSLTCRRALNAALALSLLASLFVAPVSAGAAYPSFQFTGAGYGHGIGLSQYGSKGWAEHGKTGSWIATYYYPGSKIGTADTRTMYVNLDADANYRSTSSGYNSGYTRSTWRIRPGFVGGKLKINGVERPDSTYTFTATTSGGSPAMKVTNSGGTVIGTYTGTLLVEPASTSQWLLQVVDASGAFDHTYVRYRGRMQVRVNSSGKLKLLNKLSMSEYLKGVIPRETPASWHIEALKAQSIVARSYAYVSSGDLYCTTWSQVYNGHSRGDRAAPTMHEDDRSSAAVDVTNNQYVTYNGSVIQTYFHSSSGGHTANIEDVWPGTGQPSSSYPYRKGVSDPYCAGPYDPWSDAPTYDGMVLANKIKGYVSGEPSGAGSTVYVKSLALERVWPSGFVKTVDITWSNGAVTSNVAGDTFRSALGLRSTKFFVNGKFSRIALGDRYDTAVAISKQTYPSAGLAKGAVIVNGSNDKFPDALTAAALAGTVDGPVLLVSGSTLPGAVANELKRLGVTKAYVVGGTASVPAATFNAVKAIVPTTKRLAGSDRYGYDRYGTAASVAMEMKVLAPSTKVLVATGENWPDAAVAAGVAAGSKRPLLLVRKDAMPSGTVYALRDLGATESAVFGGANAISSRTIATLVRETGESAPTKRFGMTGGRYDVAVEAAKWSVSTFGYTLSTVYIASGQTFPDTVTGGVLAGKNKHPLLLTPAKDPASATCGYLAANRATVANVTVIGGPLAVSDACASTIASYAY